MRGATNIGFVLLGTLFLTACGVEEEPHGYQDPGPPQPGIDAGTVVQTFCIGTKIFGDFSVVVIHRRFDFENGQPAFVDCSIMATNTVEARKDGLANFWAPGSPEDTVSHCYVWHDLGTENGSGDGRFDFYMSPGDDKGYARYYDNPGPGYEYHDQTIDLNCEVTAG